MNLFFPLIKSEYQGSVRELVLSIDKVWYEYQLDMSTKVRERVLYIDKVWYEYQLDTSTKVAWTCSFHW